MMQWTVYEHVHERGIKRGQISCCMLRQLDHVGHVSHTTWPTSSTRLLSMDSNREVRLPVQVQVTIALANLAERNVLIQWNSAPFCIVEFTTPAIEVDEVEARFVFAFGPESCLCFAGEWQIELVFKRPCLVLRGRIIIKVPAWHRKNCARVGLFDHVWPVFSGNSTQESTRLYIASVYIECFLVLEFSWLLGKVPKGFIFKGDLAAGVG